MRPFTTKHKTIWLCLSGWWARWLSHIWVIKALAEHHIIPTHVSGTSMWAIIAVLYASGYSVENMIHSATTLGRKQILPDWLEFWKSQKKWLLSMKYLHQILEHLPQQRLEQLPIPTWISVTNMSQWISTSYHQWDIVPLVMASAAIPWLFDPIKYEWQLLADGGIANNFPLEPLLECDIIIWSDVNPYQGVDRSIKTQELISRALTISFNQAVVTKAHHCHLFVQPRELDAYHLLDFDKAETIINLWYQATLQQLQHSDNPVIKDYLHTS